MSEARSPPTTSPHSVWEGHNIVRETITTCFCPWTPVPPSPRGAGPAGGPRSGPEPQQGTHLPSETNFSQPIPTYYDDSIVVSEVHDLLCIRVVGGPVGVRPHPLHQVVVPGKEVEVLQVAALPGSQGQVQALAPEVRVLVPAEAPEVEGSVVYPG